ncbi:MAG: hypothetical protein SWX82_31495 [Cyanobacteriota bacterium]|nr:hypothetical protein [Cyanobacteriota bacterium]
MSKLVRNKKGKVMIVLGEGEKQKAEKPLSVKVPQDIDEYVRSLPNRSQWLEEALTKSEVSKSASQQVYPPLTQPTPAPPRRGANPPLTPPRRGTRGFELRSKNIAP